MIQLNRPTVSSLLGAAILACGSAVAITWVGRIPSSLHAEPSTVMVFSSALCIAWLGLALGAALVLHEQWLRPLQTLLGSLVALVGLLVVIEHATGASLGVDWEGLHRWAMPDAPQPGRMAVASAVTFVIAGLALVLMNRVRRLWRGIAVQSLTALVGAMGAIGIVGWLLRLDLAYEDYFFGRMSLLGAFSFVLISLGLWLDWRRMDWYRSRGLIANEGLRISLNAMVSLAIMITAALLGGFALLAQQLDDRARAFLTEPLVRRAEQMRAGIELRLAQASAIATNPAHVSALRALGAQPGDTKALVQLAATAEVLLAQGYSGLGFRSAAGRSWAEFGRFAEQPALTVPLAVPGATLLWRDGIVLQSSLRVAQGDAALGLVVTEQRMHRMRTMLEYPFDFAASGVVVLCGRSGDALHCFPRRGEEHPTTLPHQETLPVARALRGESGIRVLQDPEWGRVMAAYGPVGNLGLGLVVQMKTTELYAPLRKQMAWVLVMLAVLLAAGSLLLHWRIAPLARRLHLQEQRLKLALDSARSAVWDADLANEVVYLSGQWPALLGEKGQARSVPLRELYGVVHPDDAPQAWRRLRAALKGDDPNYDVEHRVRAASGDWVWIHSVGRVVERNAHGRAVRMIGVNTNIARRKQEQSFIERRASRDDATGLPNRSVFTDRLQTAMARSRRAPPDRSLMAVLCVKIEEFGAVAEELGRDAGAALLREITQRFQQCVRATDTIARIGVDEFAIILEELGLTGQAAGIADKLVAALQPRVALRAGPVQARASVGVSYYDGVIEISAEELVAKAQNAMHEARAEGPNTVRLAL